MIDWLTDPFTPWRLIAGFTGWAIIAVVLMAACFDIKRFLK